MVPRLKSAHPDVIRLAERFKANDVPPYETLTVAEARLALEQVTRLQGPPVPVARVRDVKLPGAVCQIDARLYHPEPEALLPLVVYIHGGGWVLGSTDAADRPCRRICRAGNCAVVSLDYRLAPETKFPGPLDDCVSAVRWLRQHATELGGDTDRLLLLGDSAGGNLAAATSLTLRDEGGPNCAAQILLYPCLYPAKDSPFASYDENADAPLMTRATMEWFWDHYLAEPGDGDDPRAAPLKATSLAGLPPTFVIVAELDPLRDEGLAFAERLDAAGTSVVSTLYRGAAHGFWWMDAALSQATDLDEQLGNAIRACSKH